MKNFIANCRTVLKAVGLPHAYEASCIPNRIEKLYFSGAIDRDAAEESMTIARAAVVAVLRDIADEIEGNNAFVKAEVANLRRF